MFIEHEYFYKHKVLEKYGINILYTKKCLGDIRSEISQDILIQNLSLDKNKIFSGHQTHSDNIAIINAGTKQYFDDTDGFITNMSDVVIFTKYADCLPIFIYDKKNKAYGCVHSGWQGSFKEIGKKAVDLFVEQYDSKLDDIIIVFGIGISSKNYEVGNEFYEKFKNKFDKIKLENVFYFKDDKIYFDNQKLNYNILLEMGLKKENVFCNDLCTYDNQKLHSYRRDKNNSGRNGAYIFIDINR